jgi:hypothetical protein
MCLLPSYPEFRLDPICSAMTVVSPTPNSNGLTDWRTTMIPSFPFSKPITHLPFDQQLRASIP